MPGRRTQSTTTSPSPSASPQLARERAYAALQEKVFSREFVAGMAISEASLARELGISRTPLREAIGQMIAEGFFRQIPRQGTVVREFPVREIAELYDLREALEVYAVGKAAERTLLPPERATLERLVDEVLAIRTELIESGPARLDAAQMKRFIQADLSYHTLLLKLTGNARLTKVVGEARVLLGVFALRRHGHDEGELEQIHAYHRRVLDAVIRQDPDEARRLLGEHIRVSKRERLQELEQQERDEAVRQALSAIGAPAGLAG